MITVYSKSNCTQCDATFIILDERDVEYRVVKIDEDPEALAYVKSLGFQSAPVVIPSDQKPFSGFRPELLNTL
jgi:glutaredoxin-like protein NrdH